MPTRPSLPDGIRRTLDDLARWDAEKAAAPIVTRNAVIQLNDKIDALTGAVAELAKSSERSSRRVVQLTAALVFLTLVIAGLTILLVLAG